MTLLRVGGHHDFTDEEQVMAWHQHCGEANSNEALPVYARGAERRSEQYFLELLRSVRVHQ
jgi:hypothetical protein